MRSMKRLLLACLVLAASAFTSSHSEAGFESIFDGKTLDGWNLLGKKGAGYTVSGGAITCSRGSGGNLLYERELTDFVLRFEFKLEAGSNSGLCVRCPMSDKDLAYAGNELQIIDNSAERYKDIKSWQKHGSLYNVQGARTGSLKPVGQWNRQEVTVQGTTIRVVLNGTTILDVDTSQVDNAETLAKHPGLKRGSGHIGFLGHNEPVQFRNLRVKRL